jgi:hypothetical protein
MSNDRIDALIDELRAAASDLPEPKQMGKKGER